MVCPFCKEEMTDGTVTVRGTMSGFILFGLSYKNCYFHPINGGDEKILIEDNGSKYAYRCDKCNITIIDEGSSNEGIVSI